MAEDGPASDQDAAAGDVPAADASASDSDPMSDDEAQGCEDDVPKDTFVCGAGNKRRRLSRPVKNMWTRQQ